MTAAGSAAVIRQRNRLGLARYTYVCTAPESVHSRQAPEAFIHSTHRVQKGRSLAKEEGIVVDGHVTEVLPDRKYRVELENGHVVLAYGAGKMTKFKIRVMVGDRVTLSLSPYDLTRGRITYRHKT